MRWRSGRAQFWERKRRYYSSPFCVCLARSAGIFCFSVSDRLRKFASHPILMRFSSPSAEVSISNFASHPIFLRPSSPFAEVRALKTASPPILVRFSSPSAEVSFLKFPFPPIFVRFSSPSAEVSISKYASPPILVRPLSPSAEVRALKIASPPILVRALSPSAEVRFQKTAFPPILVRAWYNADVKVCTTFPWIMVIWFLITEGISVKSSVSHDFWQNMNISFILSWEFRINDPLITVYFPDITLSFRVLSVLLSWVPLSCDLRMEYKNDSLIVSIGYPASVSASSVVMTSSWFSGMGLSRKSED